jgi:hypothetical protein
MQLLLLEDGLGEEPLEVGRHGDVAQGFVGWY